MLQGEHCWIREIIHLSNHCKKSTDLCRVNHILDYSKISGFVRSHKGKSDRKGDRTPSTAGGDHEGAGVSQVDLARMTEE